MREQIGNQACVARHVLTRQHHSGAHARARRQARLNLARFDPIAADLDLKVVASQVLQAAIGAPARQVPGAVHARAGHERIGQETLGSEFWPVQVAPGHARPADEQFAEHTDRDSLGVAVQHVHPCVGDGPADQYRACLAGVDPGASGPDRRLGGAIQIPQLANAFAQFKGERWRQGLSATQGLEPLATLPADAEQHAPGRRRCLHDGDCMFLDQCGKSMRIRALMLGGKNNSRTTGQRQEQLQYGDVKRDGGDGQQAVAAVHSGGEAHRFEKIHD